MANINAVSLNDAIPIMLDMLKNGNTVSLVVKGNSMFPFLISGRDKVLLAPVTSPLKKGDIVLYKNRNGKYALHRISKIDKQGNLEIIGDGQLVADYPVCFDNIVAKVERITRKGKELYNKSATWKLFSNPLFLKLSRKFLVKKAIKKGSENSD